MGDHVRSLSGAGLATRPRESTRRWGQGLQPFSCSWETETRGGGTLPTSVEGVGGHLAWGPGPPKTKL